MKRKIGIFAFFLAVCMLFSTNGYYEVPVQADERSELEAQLEALEKQEQAIKDSLSKASSDLSASRERKKLLDSQIANVTNQIELLNQQMETIKANIQTKEKQIAQAERDIADKEAAIQDTHDKLGDRLRTIAKSGNLSGIQRLFNTDNYKEYLLKSKAAECIAKRDQQLMDELEAALAEIHKQKEQLQQQKADIEAERADVEKLQENSKGKKKELETLYAAAQSEERKLQNSISDYNDELKETQKKIDEANAAIEELIRQSQSKGTYNDDSLMFWPVPSVRVISSHYGPRWGTMHRGMDISNGPVPIYGENILAAADGVVLKVNSTSRWGSGWSYGYGYCIIIDHGTDSQGRKIHTLYAHCSKVNVREGQEVTGGQTVIAQAGNTGDVTGPHLHFEVRVDGVRVNPYPNYVHPDYN